MRRDISNLPIRQSDESYHRTLGIIRARAQSDLRVHMEDSTDIGSKFTVCNHGLCDENLRETMDGVYREEHHVCPHDSRYFSVEGERLTTSSVTPLNGCFWTCMAFKRKGKIKERVIRATEGVP